MNAPVLRAVAMGGEVGRDALRLHHAEHVKASLRRWLEGGAGREVITNLRRAARGGPLLWCVSLCDAHSCVASDLRADLTDAMAHALAIAEAP